MPFSCSKFSLFFERVDTISEGATLDCSNGVFRHYDEKTHLCLIHKKRPLLCRVAAYYDALQSTKLSREEWYWLNEEAIRRLQEEGTTKMGQRPLPYDKKNRPEGIIFFLIGSFFTLFCRNDGSFELFSNEFLYCVGMEKVRNLFIGRVVLIFFASSKDHDCKGLIIFSQKRPCFLTSIPLLMT